MPFHPDSGKKHPFKHPSESIGTNKIRTKHAKAGFGIQNSGTGYFFEPHMGKIGNFAFRNKVITL